MVDDNFLEEEGRYAPPRPVTPDRGPNWNGGVAPPPPNGRYDYNGGSPVNSPDEPLKPGNGWVWEGPQTPQWNDQLQQWDRGVWEQRFNEGIGAVNQTDTPPPPVQPPPPSNDGRVAPMGGGGNGINIPSSTLPPDILGLFNKPPQKTPVQSAYQDALLKFMGRSQETPTLNDSILGPQTEVYRAAAQRGQERNRRAVAERAAANGQSQSGFLDTKINQGIQEQNFNTASFNANLLGQEMNKRRDELMAGLQLARATGDAEAERELRARLAQVSASMQQQGLNLQGQLGAGDLALRQLLAQMGDSQFYDQLGVNTALNLEGLNQRALELVMRGGNP